MDISAITSNKNNFSYEHLNSNLMPQIALQQPFKSPQFIKHFSSVHLKVNTQLKFVNGGLLLDQNFNYPFLSEFFQYLSFQQRKHSHRQFNFSKQQLFLHKQYQCQMTNLKKSRKCIMCFTTIAWGEHYVKMPTYKIIHYKSMHTPRLRSYYYV